MTLHAPFPASHDDASLPTRGFGKRLGTALGQWWSAGGALWALGLGFASVFVWLPAFRLIARGLGQMGEQAWAGLGALWPHPAFLSWHVQLDTWVEPMAPPGGLAFEAWLFALVALAGLAGLAAAPIGLIWRPRVGSRLARRRLARVGLHLILGTTALVLVPLVLGWLGVWQAARIGDAATRWGGLTLAAAAAGGGLIVVYAIRGRGVDSWGGVVAGAAIAVLGPALVVIGAYQVVWLGWLAGLPLVQLALLAFVFAGGWGLYHGGQLVAFGACGDAGQPLDLLAQASDGTRVALAVECLRLLEGQAWRAGAVSLDRLARVLDVAPNQAAFVLSGLERHGIVALHLDASGARQVQLCADLADVSVQDVALSQGGAMALTPGVLPPDGGVDNCLLYAAQLQRDALDISLFDLFHHHADGSADRRSLGIFPLVAAAQVVTGTEPKATGKVAFESFDLETAFPVGDDGQAPDFDDPFWHSADLSGLSGLDGAIANDREAPLRPAINDNPRQETRAS